MPDADDIVKVEIDAELVDRLRDAQQAYDEVREYLDSIKDEIKARYADKDNVIGVHGDDEVFTCVRRESTRLNSSKFKRDWPDLWRQYSTTSSSVYLSIKASKGASS